MNPLLIGIAGGSGCGKSTFSEALERRLSEYKTFLIHMNRYYRDPLPQIVSPVTQRPDVDWNHPDSLDYEKPLNLIKAIKAEHSYEIAIVEGAFLYCYDAKFQEQKYALPSRVYADIILNGYKLDGTALDVLLAWIQRKTQQ